MEGRLNIMKITKIALTIGLIISPLAYSGDLKFAVNPSKVIKNQYIVVFKDTTLSPSVMSLNNTDNNNGYAMAVNNAVSSVSKSLNAKVSRKFSSAIKGAVFTMDAKTAKKMAQNPLVDYIEPDEMVTINGTQNSPTWGLDRVDQTNGSIDNQYIYDTTASNVNVYVIDTGVNNHSDFNGRVYSGYDFVDNDFNSSDCQGHGTHVAGTIASNTYGVAKSAKVYGVRVLNCQGTCSNSGILAGMDWVAQNHSKPAVANMSLGGGFSTSLNTAANNLVSSGVITVVAAGNDNSNACNYSPASASGVITVGSTANGDYRSSFSNYGTCVDIFAPGSNITSTSISGGSETMSGTSMASPHVAGVAALYMAGNPNATTYAVEQALLNNATQNVISDVQGSPNLMVYSRFGGDCVNDCQNKDVLENGQAENNLSASAGNEIEYTMEVPAGATDISFAMSGGSGDADLYVKFGSAPTDSSYDCRPYKNGNTESCTGTQSGGTYYVRIKAYSNFSNVSLVGNYTLDTGGAEPINISESNISIGQNQWSRYTYDLPTVYSSMTVSIAGGSGDADMYIRHGAESTQSLYDCRPYKNGNNESCTFSLPASGTWHLDLYGYSAVSGLTLNLKAN